MFRTLLEFLVERSLLESRQAPGWLRWLVRHDRRLHAHREQALAVDCALRSGASLRRREMARQSEAVAAIEPVRLRSPELRPARSAARWGWLAATAAALVGVAAFVNHYHQRQVNAARAQFVSTRLAQVPDDMLSMIAEAARSSRELSPLAQLTLPDVNPWSDIPRGTQGQLRESFSAWGSHLSDLGEQVYEQFDLRTEAELN